jgi:Uma2 family endonuclease
MSTPASGDCNSEYRAAAVGPRVLRLYARFGVKEYLIGDPANKGLEVLALKEDRYELHCCAEEKGKLSSLILARLEFDLSEIQ